MEINYLKKGLSPSRFFFGSKNWNRELIPSSSYSSSKENITFNFRHLNDSQQEEDVTSEMMDLIKMQIHEENNGMGE